MARQLVEEHGGEVPSDYDALLRLPGVGRKTANVISAIIFDRPTMAVDTHVFRVANRIGLTTRSRTPLATERELTRNIPDADIPLAHHWLPSTVATFVRPVPPIARSAGFASFVRSLRGNKSCPYIGQDVGA
jgi:endonuclease III